MNFIIVIPQLVLQSLENASKKLPYTNASYLNTILMVSSTYAGIKYAKNCDIRLLLRHPTPADNLCLVIYKD